MLEQEYQYFVDHKEELFAKYAGKYVSIVGDNVVGAYSSENEAYVETSKKYKVGTFLIKLCDATSEAYKQTFHSRASFV